MTLVDVGYCDKICTIPAIWYSILGSPSEFQIALSRCSTHQCFNEKYGFSFERAGVVRSVGAKCTGFNPTDRVFMAARGSMRQSPRYSQMQIVHLPPHLTFEDAASLIDPAITAVSSSLIEVWRLRRGEVLIHSAAGATEQPVITLMQLWSL